MAGEGVVCTGRRHAAENPKTIEESNALTRRGNLRHNFQRLYGEEIFRKTKRLEKLRRKKARLLSSLAFLLRCRDSDTVPSCVAVEHHVRTQKARRILRRASLALLRERLQYTRRALQCCSQELYHLHLELSEVLEPTDWDTLDRITFDSAQSTLKSAREAQVEEFERLDRKQHKTDGLSGSEKDRQPADGPGEDRRVVNLTGHRLSGAAVSILSKGLDFAVAPRAIPKEDIVVAVEEAVRDLPTADAVRVAVARVLRQARPPRPNITAAERRALRELRENDELVVLPADKGGAAVVLAAEDYGSKMADLVREGKYEACESSPTAGIEKMTRKRIKKSSIPAEQQKALLPSSALAPRLYGLPKVHEDGVPMRPIVSSVGTPTHHLARYLARSLRPLCGRTASFVKNPAHFVDILKSKRVGKDDLLARFDVASFCASVPVEESVAAIRDLVGEGLPEDFPDLVDFCLRNSYFLWSGKYFRQTEGLATGSPLSPVVADIYMEAFERRVLISDHGAVKKPSHWLRHADDIFVVWPHGRQELDAFLLHLNAQCPSMRFTMEVEEGGELLFLGVLVSRKEDGTLGCSVRGRDQRALPYNNPELANTRTQPAVIIKDGKSLSREEENLVGALKSHGHGKDHFRANSPKDLCRTKSPKDLFRAREKKNDARKGPSKENAAARADLPYVRGTTEKIARILSEHDVKTRFVGCKSTGDHLPRPKDRIPRTLYEGVYELQCSCGSSYVGQTGRSIRVRAQEHRDAARKRQTRTSALAGHVCSGPGHAVDFERVRVLAVESRHRPRLVREAIEIAKRPGRCNRDEGCTLHGAWKELFGGGKLGARVDRA